jgi:hypothetical protein
MAKREPKFIRNLKKQMAKSQAKYTRDHKKEEFEKVKAKGKEETYGDLYGIFCGLSKKAIVSAACWRIEWLASAGCSPTEIIERMEPKRIDQGIG